MLRPMRLALAALVLMALAAACGGDDGDRPAPAKPKDAGSDATKDAGSDAPTDAVVQVDADATADAGCNAGEVRDCKVILDDQGGIKNCFVGVQYCADGGWGPCQDPITD